MNQAAAVDIWRGPAIPFRGGSSVNAKVVLVSSQPDFLEPGGTVFERRGTLVYSAPSAPALRAVLLEVVPELIVVNGGSPAGDLLDVLQMIRSQTNPHDTAVILVMRPAEQHLIPDWFALRARTQVSDYPCTTTEVMHDAAVLAGWTQRHHTRVKVRVLVLLRKRVFTVNGYTVDLSKGGMGLMTRDALPVGEIGICTFTLDPAEGELSVPAVVVRSVAGEEGHTHGLEFIDPTVQQLTQIANYISREQTARPRPALVG